MLNVISQTGRIALDGLRLLIIGWLLGIASPLITSIIKRYLRKPRIIRAITSELDELQIRLALAAGTLGRRHATYDRKFLMWLQSVLSNYKGIEGQIAAANLDYDKLLSLEDSQIAALTQQFRDSREGVGISLKTYCLPFISANMQEVSLLRIDCQRLLLDIRSRLDLT